jgi:RNA polymerase sigma factor (sigma-70 family)
MGALGRLPWWGGPKVGLADMADGNVNLDAVIDGLGSDDPGTEIRSMDAWLQQLRPALTAFLRRKLQDPADLHDALQETSLRAWSYAARSEVRAPVSICFRIAENVAIDFARAQRRAPFTGQASEIEKLATEDPGPERSATATQRLDLVKKVIGGLPPGCRHVFLLSRSNGLSNPEIAKRCGVSIKLVEKQISRALRELREQSREWEGE